MNTIANDIIIHRGETFSMDFIVKNRDGSPYIISKKLDNPYIRISIANSKYDVNERRLINFWLAIPDTFPKFYSTVPVEINNFVGWYAVENDDVWYITNGQSGQQYRMDSLFTNGTIYKYAKFRSDSDVSAQQRQIDFLNYPDFRITCPFASEFTKTLSEYQYQYSISLVSGESTEDYIDQLCSEKGVSGTTLEEKYENLVAAGVKFSSDFDITAPIHVISVKLPILNTSKLNVISDVEV